MRNTHSLLSGLVLALLVLLPAGRAVADSLGQITGLHAETRTVQIDGQEYALSSTAELGYEGQSGRLVALQSLKSGQPVRYETRVDADGNRIITRLILLSE